jgi:hypothetical protein
VGDSVSRVAHQDDCKPPGPHQLRSDLRLLCWKRLLYGGTCIADPFRNFLAGSNMEGEATLTEIDRAQTVRGKFDRRTI